MVDDMMPRDPYGDQLSAARFKAERDLARQEIDRMRPVFEWVEGHGGLPHVKDICRDLRAVAERLGIEWSESEPHGLMDALDRRLMPDGMEWPRYEDGEQVLINDEVLLSNGITEELYQVHFYGTGFSLYMETCDIDYEYGMRVKRPAPKVTDADGVEIHVGDRVWLHNSPEDCYVVESIVDERSVKLAGFTYSTAVEYISHRAPVLGADKRPLREGETVWSLVSGERFTITSIDAEKGWPHISKSGKEEDSFPMMNADKKLTHERPDNWERLEDDATLAPAAYCHDRGLACACDPDPDAATYIEAMARDLVRRAKALAGGA